jgi:hypothetical protein
MSSKAFKAGDQVRVVENGFGSGPVSLGETIGIVRSVDEGRRRTEPYYIYSVELPGEDTLIDFEYRELELVSLVSDEFRAMD